MEVVFDCGSALLYRRLGPESQFLIFLLPSGGRMRVGGVLVQADDSTVRLLYDRMEVRLRVLLRERLSPSSSERSCHFSLVNEVVDRVAEP